MAAIDKICGSIEQYDEFYAWVEKTHQRFLCRFYPRDGYINEYDRPITSLPEEADALFLLTCPLVWAVACIIEQYGLEERFIKALEACK